VYANEAHAHEVHAREIHAHQRFCEDLVRQNAFASVPALATISASSYNVLDHSTKFISQKVLDFAKQGGIAPEADNQAFSPSPFP
jgi:hypothetical protein